MNLSDSAVDQVIAAVEAGDVDAARLLLHPYLHWSEGDVRVRGRTTVLEQLRGCARLARPTSVELRDGQIYRWTGEAPSSG